MVTPMRGSAMLEGCMSWDRGPLLNYLILVPTFGKNGRFQRQLTGWIGMLQNPGNSCWGLKFMAGGLERTLEDPIALIARARYGEKRIETILLYENSYAAKQLLLRNGGNDWPENHAQGPDQLHLLADRMGMVSQAMPALFMDLSMENTLDCLI